MWGLVAPTDSVVRFVVWGAGVPIIIPRDISHVIAMTPPPQAPAAAPAARKGLFGFLRGKSGPVSPAPAARLGVLVPVEEILALATAEPIDVGGRAAVRVPHGPEALPPEVLARFETHAIAKGMLGVFSGGQARDHELIEAVGAGHPQ